MTAPIPSLDAKYAAMQVHLRGLRRVIVAFSGGVDSTFVLKASADTLGADNVLAVTGRSPSVAAPELDDARRLANLIGVEHLIVDTDEFSNANYLSNPTNRCYFCKTTLYGFLESVRVERGFSAILNGTNADDLGDYRPGLKAADEHSVASPAADAGLNKKDIRELSRRWGLPTHDKPAAPCLSSRVQYGEVITPEKLGRIAAAEALLKQLGFRECRVRHHDNLARIEIPAAELPSATQPGVAAVIDGEFRRLGYQYVTLDLGGFRSGSMNDVIPLGVRSPR